MKPKKYENLDADESIFFSRELEHIKAKTFDIKFPELKARQLLPVSFEAGPGAESITYRQFDQVGVAKLIANYADDLPRADVAAKEFTAPVKSLGASYGWNFQEVRSAAMAGKSLNQRRSGSARRAMMVEENRIAWNGDVECGLGGLLDNANIINHVIPADGIGASKKFSTKTSEQILRDLNSIATAIHETTKGIESPDTLLLPLSQYNLIFTLRLPDSDKSVGVWFLDNSPHIQNIEWLNDIDGAGPGGVDLMIAYKRDPDKLTLEIPQDFEQLPVQERNLEFVVPVHQRIGGVLIYYPLSIAKTEDI